MRDLRRLQSSVGNRAMGRLLARLPYDAKLADSASVIQAPVMWVKYPPNILTMTRVELFDAIQLIDEWVARGHDHYVAEVKAVRQQLRARAHALTTPSEYSTFRRYVKFPPNRLAQGYEWAIQHIVSDRRELSFISLDAIDEVVQDRFPGATWSASARSWIEGYLREEDRRAQRVAQLPWYQRGTFEKFEAQSKKLVEPGPDLWRELAWLWLDLRDAGQDRETTEKRVLTELASLFEQLLRAVDAAIQKDCKAREPHTWGERVRANIAKAWGDPCKPWFGPDGTHGPDELRHFQTMLRIKRDDDPFACVYYWVEYYIKAMRLLTDPKAQLEELQHQAAAAMFLHWATIVQFAPEIASSVRALAQVGARRGAGFLRHTMLGYRLALEDLGGSGAEVGAMGKRPSIVAVSPPAAGARPPVVRGPDMPDLPPPPAPATPVKTAPAPTATADATGATAPTKKPPPIPTTKVPPTAASATKPPPPPAKTLPPPPPPAFVKAKDLGFPDPKTDPTAVEKVRRAVITALSKFKSGVKAFDLPPGWLAIHALLKQNAAAINNQILEVLDIVWAGLRDPKLYADVLAEAWEQAMAADTSIEAVLLSMAEQSAGAKAVWIPRSERKELLNKPELFFERYASRAVSFVDMPLLGDPHRALTHLLQDLVVDRALKAAGKKMTSAQFRGLLAKASDQVVPSTVPGGPVIATRGQAGLRTGDYVWQMTYDLYLTTKDHLPQPEVVGQTLHDLLKLQ